MFFYYLIDAFLCSVFSEVSIFDVSVEDYPIWHCLLGNAYFKEWFQGFWTYLYIYFFYKKIFIIIYFLMKAKCLRDSLPPRLLWFKLEF